MDLSIVIPAFNESKKIAGDIKAAAEFLNSQHLTGEIIVVDDGSTDNTSQVAQGVQVSTDVQLNIIRCDSHHGKGYAVRTGIKASTGQFVMFADSGSCVPYEDTLRGLELIKKGTCDIAHGSRKMPDCHIEKNQSLYRRICAKLFHWFIIHYIGISSEYTDTQCGFKVYRGEVARSLYSKAFTDGFAFDIEIILLAQKEGYKIKEFPLDWSCDRDSRLSPSRSLFQILKELIIIKRTLSKE